jgi:peptidoglycan hydrolase-like protein with peptidoglycan-binding domain
MYARQETVMLPMVFNAVPTRLLQVDMEAAVGRGAPNRNRDARIVQSLLNGARTNGGVPLKIDGVTGPLTIAAIEAFQLRTLGFADGRVDVGGRTIRALVETLQRSSQAIAPVEGIGPPSTAVGQALVGTSARFSFGVFRPSTWKLTSSAGLSVSIGPLGGSSGSFLVEEDVAQFRRLNLAFTAFGVGISVLPAGFEEGQFALPSIGSRIKMGPFFAKPNLDPADFIGVIQIIDISGGPGSKTGGGITSFVEIDWGGPKAPIAQGSMLSRSNGTANLGISLFIGRVNSATPF